MRLDKRCTAVSRVQEHCQLSKFSVHKLYTRELPLRHILYFACSSITALASAGNRAFSRNSIKPLSDCKSFPSAPLFFVQSNIRQTIKVKCVQVDESTEYKSVQVGLIFSKGQLEKQNTPDSNSNAVFHFKCRIGCDHHSSLLNMHFLILLGCFRGYTINTVHLENELRACCILQFN